MGLDHRCTYGIKMKRAFKQKKRKKKKDINREMKETACFNLGGIDKSLCNFS